MQCLVSGWGCLAFTFESFDRGWVQNYQLPTSISDANSVSLFVRVVGVDGNQNIQTCSTDSSIACGVVRKHGNIKSSATPRVWLGPLKVFLFSVGTTQATGQLP